MNEIGGYFTSVPVYVFQFDDRNKGFTSTPTTRSLNGRTRVIVKDLDASSFHLNKFHL